MLLLKLKRLSIESKLKILAIFPLIFIIGLSFFMIYDSYEKDLKLKNVEKLLILNTKISLLLHETQKERGLSVAYLESKNDTFKKNLLNQRELTNNKIDEFKTYLVDFSYYPNQGKINIENVLKELSKIENIRNEINELKVKSKNVISYYSNLNSSLLSFVANSSYIAENEKIINNLTAYYNFLMAKERAGLERAMGSNTFTNKTFGEGMFLNFLSLINEQTVFMENFYIYGFDYEEFVKEKMQNSSVKEVQKMRDILLSYGENKNVIFDIEASYWFKTISEKINILKEIDDYISKDIIEQINIIKKDQFDKMIFILGLAIFIILITILSVSFFTKSIKRGFEKVTIGIEQFMRYLNKEINELDYISLGTKGLLGNLAKSINYNIDKINPK